jgi:hypothetical protein
MTLTFNINRMKNIYIVLLAALILISCEKNTSKKTIYFKGNVSDQTTNLPIEGIKITLFGGTYGIVGPGSSEELIITYTDENGDFTMDEKLRVKDYVDHYTIGTYDDYSSDTNQISYRYYFEYISSSNNIAYADNLENIPTYLNFTLRPSGVINFISTNLRDNNIYDTLVVKSSFSIDTIFDFNDIGLYLPPNKTYSFEISNVINNQIDQTIIEEIYIRNNRSYNSLFRFYIEFN